MKFKITFIGREKGAQGLVGHHSKEIEAGSEREAIIKLYDDYEHLRRVIVNGKDWMEIVI